MSEAERLNFSIANRYQIKKCIGKGSFATVYVADDTQNPPRKVAVKRIKHVFDDVAEAKRLLRETSIMHRIRHPNLVWIRDLYIPDQNDGDYNNIFIIMDCFQTDLKKLIHSPVFLEHSQVKFFLYQIVCGVRYLHSANILHRDLKPANILVNEDCTIHICDFGLSRSYSSLCQDMQQVEEIVAVEQTEFQLQAGGIQMRNLSRDNRIRKAQKKFTKHVVTRWYRAPEVILMEQEYDKTLDVWSIGCIYAELLGMIQGNTAGHEMRQPFFPGKSCFPLSPDLSAQLSRAGFPNSTHDQIKVIMEVLGTPSEEDLSFVSDPRALEYIQSFQQCTGKPFEESFPVSDPKELDLLRSMLKFNPQKRITLDDLIQDSYFDDIRQPQRELICEQPLDLSWDFDNNITCDELRRIFRSEIASNFPSSSQSQISKNMSDQSEIPQWHLPERYKLISKIGAGAFGSVYLARDTATRELVAIKCVRGIFDDIFDAKRLLREISILHTLRHPNVVKIKRLIIPPEEDTFNKVYIVMENCQSDLKKLSMSQVYFDTEQIKFLLYQMICGLRYIHSANILHRDLKPANLLLNSDGSLKICDFGLSRSYSRLNREYIDAKHMSKNMEYEETDSAEVAGVQIRTLQYNRLNRMNQKMTRVLTEHVVTRWYRAPEVILLEREYNTAVDVWSIGCIFAELLGMNQQNVPHFSERAPLFPGTSCFPLSPDLNCQRLQGGYVSAEGDQINLIFNVLGTPAEDDLEFITDEKALLYVQSFSQKQPKDITLNFPGSTPEEMEILSRMLVFNPFKRATLDEIIAMPYFDSVRQAEREVLATAPANFIWDNEVSMTKDELREVFRQELTRLYANY